MTNQTTTTDPTFEAFKSAEYRPDTAWHYDLFDGQIDGYDVEITNYTANVVTVRISGKLNMKRVPSFEMALRRVPGVTTSAWVAFLVTMVQQHIAVVAPGAMTYAEHFKALRAARLSVAA